VKRCAHSLVAVRVPCAAENTHAHSKRHVKSACGCAQLCSVTGSLHQAFTTRTVATAVNVRHHLAIIVHRGATLHTTHSTFIVSRTPSPYTYILLLPWGLNALCLSHVSVGCWAVTAMVVLRAVAGHGGAPRVSCLTCASIGDYTVQARAAFRSRSHGLSGAVRW